MPLHPRSVWLSLPQIRSIKRPTFLTSGFAAKHHIHDFLSVQRIAGTGYIVDAGQLSGFRIGNSGVDNRCLGLLCGYGRYLCSQGCNRDDGVNTVSNRLIINLL